MLGGHLPDLAAGPDAAGPTGRRWEQVLVHELGRLGRAA